ncbi:homeobox-leucine zipper protein HAT4-like [Impatiens glandulifera]|uniref:homeobox-leucine zipper protein HAT4-like n=1 Tax=Impatiens glandulifera TaxID=253017 RepID=UPI001FB1988D|nr:homeobox-leucine zipper protein HAT4-like [Impatiens glandulifera]
MHMDNPDLLGLNLTLSFTHNHNNSPIPIPSAVTSSTPVNHKSSWIDTFSSSIDRTNNTCRADTRSFLNGIDVNRTVSEDETGVSSPNSTVSSISGKRLIEVAGDVDDQDGDDEDGDGSRKKLRLSKDQSAILEESFKEHNTLNPKQKLILAKRLGLRPRQVEVWFQNRRARTKLKQTEVDCEFLKRCCENLTDENRRLQKEVQELRALKLSPQFYMQMTPPTTLTMCPSCERVAGAGATPCPAIHHRPMTLNPWTQAAVTPATRQFDVVRRS